MKCNVCGNECDGKLVIVDYYIVGEMKCCPVCFDFWTQNNFDELNKRIQKIKK
jgi:ribosome-binding protein aMBF1 (putative translation factor)